MNTLSDEDEEDPTVTAAGLIAAGRGAGVNGPMEALQQQVQQTPNPKPQILNPKPLNP